MPTYTVTDPQSGKTIKLTGESPPSEQELNQVFSTINQKPSFMQTVGNAVKSSITKPISFAKDLGTNPQSMANAMPALGGMAGGLSPVIGGATLGTGAGQGIRDLALKALQKPIPSGWQHAGELGTAAVGDVLAIPAIKRAHYGGEIGRLETKEGVPPPQDIPSIPMSTGQKSAGDFINEAVDNVKASQGLGQPTYWKQIKDQVDRIYDLGKDQQLTKNDRGRLRWLNQQVQEGLNKSVPGRAGPAQALAKSQTIPNFLGNVNKSLPSKYKVAGAAGAGVGIPIAAVEAIKKLLGVP